MSSNKRKAADEDEEAGAIAPTGAFHPRFPDSDTTAVQDNYYANLYTKEIDFRSLSKQDAEFAAMYGPMAVSARLEVRPTLTMRHRLKGNGQLDFSDPAAVMQLTKTLLKLDFGLKIELPSDRLCPPVSRYHSTSKGAHS